ncbi:HDIG domain-containing metalloprotein, partial [Bacillus thuringiensis]|uniref:HDIG domain-containing metalloprotein n=1 Tax=Bacillus thuringiensis TaxID=1428 RepID=UPI0011A98D99
GGTYHNSVMVANVSEDDCEVVGENGVLGGVGGYYDDVGKRVQGEFFIEKEMGIKKGYDKLDCVRSKDIIIGEVRDGVRMVEEYDIGQEIIDMGGE